MVFQACKHPLPVVPSFKYLGRVLTFSYDDWVSVISNIRKDQKWWVRMLWITWRYRTNMWVYGLFYNSVVQTVLMYGSETWVLMPRMVQTLKAFHHRVDCWMMEQHLWRISYGGCLYPPLEEAIQEVGLEII